MFVIARDLAGLRKKAIEDNAGGIPIFSGIALNGGNRSMADLRPGRACGLVLIRIKPLIAGASANALIAAAAKLATLLRAAMAAW
ncbi:hypothetical protein [Hoeflea alexandrii]